MKQLHQFEQQSRVPPRPPPLASLKRSFSDFDYEQSLQESRLKFKHVKLSKDCILHVPMASLPEQDISSQRHSELPPRKKPLKILSYSQLLPFSAYSEKLRQFLLPIVKWMSRQRGGKRREVKICRGKRSELRSKNAGTHIADGKRRRDMDCDTQEIQPTKAIYLR